MTQTTVDGICALHAVVSDQCRQNHGDRRAAEIACARLVEEYMTCLGNPPGTRFHFVLTVDRSQVQR